MLKAQLQAEQSSTEEAQQRADQLGTELKNMKVTVESLEDEVKKQSEVIKVLGSKSAEEDLNEKDSDPESKEGLLDEVRLLQRTITMFTTRDDTRGKDIIVKQQKINDLESQLAKATSDLEKQTREIEELKELNKSLANKAEEASQAAMVKAPPRASLHGGGVNRMSVFNSSKDGSMRQSTFNSNIFLP